MATQNYAGRGVAGFVEARSRSGGALSDDWVPLGEAADGVRVSTTTIVRAVAAGDLRFDNNHGHPRVERSEVEAWARRKRLIY